MFALRLLQGDVSDLSTVYEKNKRIEELEKQLAAYQSNLTNELKILITKSGGLGGNALDKLLVDNKNILSHLDELLNRGGSASDGKGHGHGHGHYHFKPPQPFPDFDGSIQFGLTYRFGNSKLNVGDKDGNALLSANPYECAFWQLQLQEWIELLARKDKELINQQKKIEKLEIKQKEFLFIQD
jgi:hypothetical protein